MISVIGIGPGADEFITPAARSRVEAAEIVIGSDRLLELFPDLTAVKRRLDGDYNGTVEYIAAVADRDVAVLVSGDPGLFSLMHKIKNRLGSKKIEVIPGISAAQFLMSRRAITWDNVTFVSVHGRDNGAEKLLAAANKNSKLVIFTGPEFTAARTAAVLIANGYHGTALVGADLSYPNERLLELSIDELSEETGLTGTTVYLELGREKISNKGPNGIGKMYAIGIGPGDPELLTLKAVKILCNVDYVFVPRSDDKSESLALRIASGYIGDGVNVSELTFPMTSDERELDSHWRQSAESVLKKIRDGNDVAFITLGDPSLYSTFAYLKRAIEEADDTIEIEIVPGISSPFACAAAAGITLAEGGDRVAIVPMPDDVMEAAALFDRFDTVVFLKVAKKLDRLMVLLADMALIDQAVLVKSVGLPQERVIKNLGKNDGMEAGLGYFSTVIVKRRI